MSKKILERPVYTSKQFELKPYNIGDTKRVMVVYRGTDDIAIGFHIAAEFGEVALRLLDCGYSIGARAVSESLQKDFVKLANATVTKLV